MKVQFKAKSVQRQAGEVVQVPTIKSIHCDMSAFRSSRRFGAYANSDLFPAMINRAVKAMIPDGCILVNNPPAGVMVERGFLAVVTIEVPDTPRNAAGRFCKAP